MLITLRLLSKFSVEKIIKFKAKYNVNICLYYKIITINGLFS